MPALTHINEQNVVPVNCIQRISSILADMLAVSPSLKLAV